MVRQHFHGGASSPGAAGSRRNLACGDRSCGTGGCPAQVAARVLEFWLMRHVHPLTSAQVATLAHPVGAAVLIATGAPASVFFTVAHGAGNGVMTIANGTLPLHIFGATSYGLRQGLLMMPARFLQAGAPFIFDLLLSRFGLAALGITAFFGVASFLALALLRAQIARK